MANDILAQIETKKKQMLQAINDFEKEHRADDVEAYWYLVRKEKALRALHGGQVLQLTLKDIT